MSVDTKLGDMLQKVDCLSVNQMVCYSILMETSDIYQTFLQVFYKTRYQNTELWHTSGTSNDCKMSGLISAQGIIALGNDSTKI